MATPTIGTFEELDGKRIGNGIVGDCKLIDNNPPAPSIGELAWTEKANHCTPRRSYSAWRTMRGYA